MVAMETTTVMKILISIVGEYCLTVFDMGFLDRQLWEGGHNKFSDEMPPF